MTSFSEIKIRADQQWEDLNSGKVPWIRIGTAMCGLASGAREVVDAFRSEISSRGIDAIVDEVGCLGICSAEPLVDIINNGLYEGRDHYK